MASQRKGKARRRQSRGLAGDSREPPAGLFVGGRVIDTQERGGDRGVDGAHGERGRRFPITVTCWEFRCHHPDFLRFSGLVPVGLWATCHC